MKNKDDIKINHKVENQPEINPSSISGLCQLGKIWGFLKYHHPNIAKGKFDWDEMLFQFLPKFLTADALKDRDQLLITWIDSLGTLDKTVECIAINDDAYLKPDLSWIELYKGELKYKLLEIYHHRNQGGHYYIDLDDDSFNPIFQNEKAYTESPFPAFEIRLLALYRYWNIIYYFFPYRHLIDKDWNEVLAQYLPLILGATNAFEYQFALLQLIAEVKDSHANLWGGADEIANWKGHNYPPVHLRFIERQVVVTDYYNPEMQGEVGLKIGDVITKINGNPVEKIIRQLVPYYPASNDAGCMRDIVQNLLRSPSNEVEIEFISAHKEIKSKTLKLFPKEQLNYYRWYPDSNEVAYRLIENNIGYVTLNGIKDSDVPKILKLFKNTKGIIIDIRNYPDAFVPYTLGSYCVSESTPFVRFTIGRVFNPGEFVLSEALEIPGEGDTYQGKLVIITNEFTQSQGEFTAMAFRAGVNATIIGSTTAGADGDMSNIILPGGLETAISGIGIYYPDGSETQRIGIIPDIEATPTIQGIREGRDEVLERAVLEVGG